jgi:hypothetical protein
MLTDGRADNVNVPDSSLELAAANTRTEVANTRAEVANTRAEVANTRAEVANTRKRRLEGDPEALQACSLEELRQVGRCSSSPR